MQSHAPNTTPDDPKKDGATLSDAENDRLHQYIFIVYILFLLGMVTGLSSLVGVIILYVKRAEFNHTPYANHATFLIRTFWVSLIVGAIGFITSFVLVGLLILPVIFIWYVYRCILGFIKFNDAQAIDPLSWF